MAFGERLQELRKRSGLTQEEFAFELQVSRQAVSKWESCRGYPEMEKIIYICNRFGVGMDELFDEEVPTAKPTAPHEAKNTLKTKPLASQLSAFYANLSPYHKLVGFTLLAVIALLGPAYVFCMRSLQGGADEIMTVIWIVAVIVFGIAEAATAGLVSIWFVAGSVAALICCELGGEMWLQFVLFLVVSIAALLLTRPIARKMMTGGVTPTNADRVLHAAAKVTEEIDNISGTGAVYIDGKTWSARSEDGSVIPAGAKVEVIKMEGVKLFVRKI